MPYDLQADTLTDSRGIRDQILELMSRKALDASMSEQHYHMALKAIVTCARESADTLFDEYHGSRKDTRSKTYARYAY